MLRSIFTSAPLGAAVVFCLATMGCAATSNENQDAPPLPPPEVEEPLELTVDDLALRNGTLRISATMTDGSADVSMWLGEGEGCQTHEVGHGFATRAGFTWALSADDVTRALECGLVVNAHGVNEDGDRVKKVAALEVAPSVVDDETMTVALVSTVSDRKTMTLRFASTVAATHLHIAGTVIGAEDEPPEEQPERTKVKRRGRVLRKMFQRSFVVDNDDIAASMLHRRRLSVLGEHFLATITIGGVTLDVSDPVEETFGGEG